MIWHHDVSLWGDTSDKSFWRPRVHNELGLAYAREGLFYKSENEYLISIKLNPFYINPHNNLAGLYYVMGKFEESAGLSLFVLKLDSSNLPAINNLAVVYYKHLKEFEKAIELLKSIVKISPREKKAFFNLGNIYIILGKNKEAEQMYLKALEIESTYDEARLALIELEKQKKTNN